MTLSAITTNTRPGPAAKYWRNQVPGWLGDHVDKEVNDRWTEIRNALIGLGIDCRKTFLTVDRIVLWAIPGQDPNIEPKLAVKTAPPEVQVLIEQAKQYHVFKSMANDCKTSLELYREKLKDADGDSASMLSESMEHCRSEQLKAEKEAAKILADIRETAIRLKTLASNVMKSSEASLAKLATLGQQLLLAKERMEMERERQTPQVAEMTDAELLVMATTKHNTVATVSVDDNDDQ